MTRRDSLGDDLRARIYDAALNLFAVEGHHAVAVPRIAEEAQVGVGSIYRVAESKQDLADELFVRWQTAFNTDVLMAEEMSADDCRKDFLGHWKRVTDWALKYPMQLRFLIVHQMSKDSEGSSVDTAARFLRDAAGGWARKGMKNGQLSDFEPEAFSALARGPLITLMLDGELTRKNIESVGDIIWRGIRA